MKKALFSLVAVLLLTMSGIAQTTYTMVNSASQLEPGQYILVGYDNEGQAFVMSYQKSNNRHALTIDENGGVITATVATDPSSQDEPFEFTLDGAPGAWTLFDALNNGYLYAAGGGNYLRTQSTLDDKGRWTITDGDEGGMVPVSNGGVEQCYMRYNITSTLFGCYKESSNVAAPVYFFKAGGTPAQPDPEPSNYPTNFTATVDGTDVTLTWTDATGTQLPDKYLVLASTGNITVPVDGTPVANGDLAMNVNYGAQTVTFGALQGGTAYHFAIFPYTNSGANIDYKTDGSYPTATAATEQIFTLLFEDFDEDLGVFTAYDMYGDQGWHQGSYQGTTYAVCNGYANQVYNENEDWLISPAISSNGNQDALLSFRTAMKFDGDPLQVKVSVDYDGQSEPTDFEWTDITDAFDFSTGNYEWVESGEVNIWGILDGYGLGYPDFYVAFVYKSSTESASSWEIDYVKVISHGTEAVEENNRTVGLYPNPAREQVSFNIENDAQVSIYDMTGRMVSTTDCMAGEAQINVSELVNGVYFVNFRFADGTKAVSKFVKY